MVWRVRVFVGLLLSLAVVDRIEPTWSSWVAFAAVGSYLVVVVPGLTVRR